MRPKKKVLVLGTDEDHMGILCLVLKSWGFKMQRCTKGADSTRELKARCYDAALMLGFDEAGVKTWKRVSPETPVVVYAVGTVVPALSTTDRYILENCGVAALIDALKTACARKRGPKKGTKYDRTRRSTDVAGYPAVVLRGGAQVTARRKAKAA